MSGSTPRFPRRAGDANATGAGPGSGSSDCPDWHRLAAARDASPVDPDGWDEALRHLDGCSHCRQAAVKVDPLLAFRRLPTPPLAADEGEAMLRRVAAMRAAGRVSPPARRGRGLATSLRALPLRQLAAATVAFAALLAGGTAPHRTGPPESTLAVHPSAAASGRLALDAALAAEPVLDEFDQPFDHVVQWNGDDLSVVLVVDERLGV